MSKTTIILEKLDYSRQKNSIPLLFHSEVVKWAQYVVSLLQGTYKLNLVRIRLSSKKGEGCRMGRYPAWFPFGLFETVCEE